MCYGGLGGVLHRFWVVPDPEICFRSLNLQIGNKLSKSILFEQSRVELALDKDEPSLNRRL